MKQDYPFFLELETHIKEVRGFGEEITKFVVFRRDPKLIGHVRHCFERIIFTSKQAIKLIDKSYPDCKKHED